MSLIRIEESGDPVEGLIDALEPIHDTGAIAAAMAETASELVRSTFSATRSPDGVTWRPVLRPRAGIGGALLLTGDLRDEASEAKVDPDGFTFTVAGVKGVHQHGSRRRNLPARPFLPDAGRLPVTWAQALDAAALRHLTARL
jgi:phage gpG-like protein